MKLKTIEYMKTLKVFIAFFLLSSKFLMAQLPLNFGSSGWKYYMKNNSPIRPSDYITISGDVGFPGTYNWTSPNYNTVYGVSWPSGASLPLGYGSNWPSYFLGFVWGTNPSVSPIPRTSYYRKTLTGVTGYTSMTVKCKSDDAVVIYLNGIEVHRTSNLPPFPTAILPTENPTSFINSSSALSAFQTSVTISGSTLANILTAHPSLGHLTVTAEVHQNDAGSGEFTTSSDSFFDIEITGISDPSTSTIARGPYLQLPTPTGIQVRWATNISEMGKVCYSSSGPITVAHPGTCVSESINNLDHKLFLTSLVPNSKYYYSIQNTTNTLFEGSDEHFFITPPHSIDNTKTTRIWVTGDASQDHYTLVQPAVLSAFENHKNTYNISSVDLWLLLGDIGNEYGSISEYDSRFFNIYDASSSHVMKQTPILTTPGNHDYFNGGTITPSLASTLDSKNKLRSGDPFNIFSTTPSQFDSRYFKTNPYFDIFTMPDVSIPHIATKYKTDNLVTGKKAYYSYNHNNIHFICLDSYGFYNDYLIYGNIPLTVGGSSINPQFNWLVADLNAAKLDPNIKWTIMFWHHSPYTRGGGHFSDDVVADEYILRGIRENLIKYLDDAEYKVDLVLNGHSHSYERSKLLKNHDGFEASFNPANHNNPSLIPGFNSNANSNGKFNSSTACPYIKSSSNSVNEGVIYVLTGSAGQLQTSALTKTIGHLALNGASFPLSIANPNSRGTIQEEKGGSFYVEIKDNRLDAMFIEEGTGAIKDNFTIMKDVNSSSTIVNQIHQNELPGQSAALQIISTPAWPGVSQFTITNPSGAISGLLPAGEINVPTPDIGSLYTIKDQFGCLSQTYRFTFNGSCWGNVTINNTFHPTASPEVISSSGTITSTSLIKNMANVSFFSKMHIDLVTTGSGVLFQAELGSIFSATINTTIVCPPSGM
jgi:hypothetical protein